MRRSHPKIRGDAFPVENLQTGAQLAMLLLVRQAGKFTVPIPSNQPPLLGDIGVLVPMEANRPTAPLPLPDTVPEARVGRFLVELRVLIVGHHGQDGSNIVGD